MTASPLSTRPQANSWRLIKNTWKWPDTSAQEVATLSLEKVCSADPPFTIQDARELKRKALEEGPQLFEWRAEARDGRRFWVEINLALTPLGGRDRLLAVIRDISERKQAEDIRRRAYEELEELVDERTAGLQSANAHLRREIEERRRTEGIIRLQRDLALTLSGRMGLQETLRLCLETAITISGMDSGGVYVVDPASGDLDLAYHQGLSPEFVRQAAHYDADDINTYLVMAGKPLYARLEDLPGIMDEEGLKEGLRSVAIIPVIHQDRVIASINVASHHYEEVPATARAALETLAAQVGSAIARVQAEEALRRAKNDLELRVTARTAQLRQANESLEAELRVRRDMEKSLRYSETKYRTLVEQIPAITYMVSLAPGLDTLYVSPQIETLLGFSPEEWRADNLEIWKRQIHPEDRERVVAEITHSMATGKPFAAEYRLLAKSGRVVWFRDEAWVVPDPEGQFLVLQGLALDITERKLAEEALRETTHTLQTLIQASPLAIITLDLDFKITLWNPGAERMLGWKESEVLGGHLPCVPGDHLPRKTPGSSGRWRERRNPPWNLSECAKTVRFLTCIYGLHRCWMPTARLSAIWGFLPISPPASGLRRSCAGRPNFWTWPTMPLSCETWTTASSSGIPGPRQPMAGARPRWWGKKPINFYTRSFPSRKRSWKPSFSAWGNGRVN